MGPKVHSYQVIPVPEGGVVAGKVYTRSPPPQVKKHPLLRFPNPEYCGQISDGHNNRDLDEFFIDERGGLKNVVIAIEGIPSGKPFPPEASSTSIRLCQLDPFVVVFWKPFSITVRNLDPLFHTLQGVQMESSRRPALFYLPLQEGENRTIPFQFSRDRRIFTMHCGVHPFSQMWGFAVKNPYFDITKKNGSFRISEITPGSYTMSIWHPTMKVTTRPLTVRPSLETRIDLELDIIQVDLPLPGLSELESKTPKEDNKNYQ